MITQRPPYGAPRESQQSHGEPSTSTLRLCRSLSSTLFVCDDAFLTFSPSGWPKVRPVFLTLPLPNLLLESEHGSRQCVGPRRSRSRLGRCSHSSSPFVCAGGSLEVPTFDVPTFFLETPVQSDLGSRHRLSVGHNRQRSPESLLRQPCYLLAKCRLHPRGMFRRCKVLGFRCRQWLRDPLVRSIQLWPQYPRGYAVPHRNERRESTSGRWRQPRPRVERQQNSRQLLVQNRHFQGQRH
mmetsp:Transcript_38558/g.57308  ORF Transcript_38558/g.57308 Transcript_38558/m.57308 type:complete len:239 (+) Transcript_38558:541-1257(+)